MSSMQRSTASTRTISCSSTRSWLIAGWRWPVMAEDRTRHRLVVSGVVQGVGFRPFVYALASKLGLSGSVGNNSSGVTIEVEGPAAVVTEFRQRLPTGAPSLARIDAVSVETVPVVGGTGFEIMESRAGAGRTLISPDIG